MECSIKSQTGYDLLSVSGEVDLQYSPQLREKILASLKAGQPVLIDLGGVAYIDSSGIASLVEGFQTAKSAKLEYGLMNVSQNAMQVLTLTRLDKVFQIVGSTSEFEDRL
jgi:anti-sigma B factor antagonist